MARWMYGVVSMTVVVTWLVSGASVSAQNGLPQQLAELREMVQQITDTLAGIEDGLSQPESTVVVTGPLQRASTPASNFKCMAVNAGNATVSFEIALMDQSGSVQKSEFCDGYTPGSVCSLEIGGATDQVSYCRVSGVPASSIRVTLCAREGAACATLVTAP